MELLACLADGSVAVAASYWYDVHPEARIIWTDQDMGCDLSAVFRLVAVDGDGVVLMWQDSNVQPIDP